MLFLQGISYIHPNKDLLFSNVDLAVNSREKIALIGVNGTGKSTFLKIITGELKPSEGTVKTDSKPYYVPQIFGQFNHLTVAQALGTDAKIKALQAILNGDMTEENMASLDDDWTIEERCLDALSQWQLTDIDLFQKMDSLSGGQKTSVFLAGLAVHQPDLVLLDEPSNHLDGMNRARLYDYVQNTTQTLVIVSHDRVLLDIPEKTLELQKTGLTTYGGNYTFYTGQKSMQTEALQNNLKSKEKELRKARETERESAERQQKRDARGKKSQDKAGLPAILLNTRKNNAENSTARMVGVHKDKVQGITQDIGKLRQEITTSAKMKMDFDQSGLHEGKILLQADKINARYGDRILWNENLSFQICSGERIAVKGANGSGKSTLLRILLGKTPLPTGIIHRADFKSIYIDQEYAIIENQNTVYEQAESFNSGVLKEHDVKIRLNRFLFEKEFWNKPCTALSGGEKMRLVLCCLSIANQAPDMIILDEPTNNLDIRNLEILADSVREYRGTLLVVSHDQSFLDQIGIERVISMPG